MTISSLLMSVLSVVSILLLHNMSYYYFVADSNKILAVATAFSSFMYFKNINIKQSKCINMVGASTFGVLLIHANSDTMRQWLWRDTLRNVEQFPKDLGYLVGHAVVSVFVIFVVCSIIDVLRVRFIEKPLLKKIRRKINNNGRIKINCMKKQKKIMLLGGIRYLLPVIEAAHKEGYWVITADYLPDNIAHKYSDEYVNVSIIDKEAVLKVAREKEIDGIMSFGVDPGVVSASYVQNKMELPSFGPYESVEILQNKDKFRSFLKDNGFNVPWAFGFSSVEEAWNKRDKFTYPLIVKPTDSAGSKGCVRVDEGSKLHEALEHAMKYTFSKRIIVEEFLEKRGCSSDSDCYAENGILNFVDFNSQMFDANAENPYTPAMYTWPSTYTSDEEKYLTSEIQRLISLLGMKTCVFNVETRVATNGKPYIMEMSPRGGGNR